MKRDAEQIPVEVSEEALRIRIVKPRNGGHGGLSLTLPAAGQDHQSRPEIEVLGWDVRSYRLALRASKI
jgi:hypothetical protein